MLKCALKNAHLWNMLIFTHIIMLFQCLCLIIEQQFYQLTLELANMCLLWAFVSHPFINLYIDDKCVYLKWNILARSNKYVTILWQVLEPSTFLYHYLNNQYFRLYNIFTNKSNQTVCYWSEGTLISVQTQITRCSLKTFENDHFC